MGEYGTAGMTSVTFTIFKSTTIELFIIREYYDRDCDCDRDHKSTNILVEKSFTRLLQSYAVFEQGLRHGSIRFLLK